VMANFQRICDSARRIWRRRGCLIPYWGTPSLIQHRFPIPYCISYYIIILYYFHALKSRWAAPSAYYYWFCLWQFLKLWLVGKSSYDQRYAIGIIYWILADC
jgi:hypothetical protein